jgi:hypothetical protein
VTLIKLILFLVVLTSCSHLIPKPKDVEYFHVSAIPRHFPDKTKVESYDLKGDYLIRHGKAKSKDCWISRSEVVLRSGLLFLKPGGVSETCKGKNCSHCGFKDSGGCECKNSLNTCEHTITRNRDFIRWY